MNKSLKIVKRLPCSETIKKEGRLTPSLVDPDTETVGLVDCDAVKLIGIRHIRTSSSMNDREDEVTRVERMPAQGLVFFFGDVGFAIGSER